MAHISVFHYCQFRNAAAFVLFDSGVFQEFQGFIQVWNGPCYKAGADEP
jgi:hypothetical protein